jgi:hypothetical protein
MPVMRCSQCKGKLLPGVAHHCPAEKAEAWLDRKTVFTLAAWLLQIVALIVTIAWYGGGLQETIRNIQREQEKLNERLERIEKYFQRPLPE